MRKYTHRVFAFKLFRVSNSSRNVRYVVPVYDILHKRVLPFSDENARVTYYKEETEPLCNNNVHLVFFFFCKFRVVVESKKKKNDWIRAVRIDIEWGGDFYLKNVLKQNGTDNSGRNRRNKRVCV